jgi:hypothetical protein
MARFAMNDAWSHISAGHPSFVARRTVHVSEALFLKHCCSIVAAASAPLVLAVVLAVVLSVEDTGGSDCTHARLQSDRVLAFPSLLPVSSGIPHSHASSQSKREREENEGHGRVQPRPRVNPEALVTRIIFEVEKKKK